MFGTSLSTGQVAVLELILDEAQARDVPLQQLAYIMATPYHEVGSPMQPISENLNYSTKAMMEAWPSRFPTTASTLGYVRQPQKLANFVYAGRMGNTAPNDGWAYRGRGLSQITGKEMYAKMGLAIGVDLVGNPDLALKPDIAVQIMFVGMLRGLFTGKKLSDCITTAKVDYVNARAIINGDVKRNGATIAGYARAFETALRAGAYSGAEAATAPTAPVAPAPPVIAPQPSVPAASTHETPPVVITPAPPPPAPQIVYPEPTPTTETKTVERNWLWRLLFAVVGAIFKRK
ncbi:hypothetical protein MesoLj113c_46060 [Mesorhizobium sp. 113-3-9]|uniref:glycoside hydrolase family 19 protein n=1 Tax=Mesorhizobium sp. 113-3-9 TaxID=2744517 RepID=UPI001938C7E5|nr:glycoside hydrolase family 19 protein [Mesorhizobium sp. 113-3-9]BCG88496.1 hypothetical protein MesoLj113c_46060 [Mesorhizobium sp. 113-3-9]